jgi:pantothenate kinase
MPNTLKETLENPNLYPGGGGKCKFYALLDQSANIKVIEHKKLSNFYIGGFSSYVEQIGLNCKKVLRTLLSFVSLDS